MSTSAGSGVPASWTHVWHWHKRPVDLDRYGMKCRVLATSRMQSAQVLFEDGVTHITSRRGLRRIKLEDT